MQITKLSRVRGVPLASIHLIADKECSRKPISSLADPYGLGPGLTRASIVNSGQGQQTCTDDEGCAPLPDQSPLHSKTRPMEHPDLMIAETASGAAASPVLGTSSSLG